MKPALKSCLNKKATRFWHQQFPVSQPCMSLCSSSFNSSSNVERKAQNLSKSTGSKDVRYLHKLLNLVSDDCKNGLTTSFETFKDLIQTCGNLKTLKECEKVHLYVISNGWEWNTLLGNLLLNMYVKCGRLVDAIRCFRIILQKDVFTWTLLIAAHADSGLYSQAWELFWIMESEGVVPNKVTFLSILKACRNLAHVEIVHEYATECGLDSDDFVRCNLLDVYAKSGSFVEAHAIFNAVPKQSVVTWNTMICGYMEHNLHSHAFALFQEMHAEDIKPDEVTYLNVLKGCTHEGFIDEARKIHVSVVEHNMETNTFVANTLVDIYAKNMSLDDASYVFDSLDKHDIVSWSVMISANVLYGNANDALCLFKQMQLNGIKPNKVTYLSVVKACAMIPCLTYGWLVHMDAIFNDFDNDGYLRSSLIDMYSSCDSIEDACAVFTNICDQDVVMWNSMIHGYSETGNNEEALKLFCKMLTNEVKQDEATFVSTLNACKNIADLEQGRLVHTYTIEVGVYCHSQVGNALVEMYAKCDCMADARHVFEQMMERPLSVWTSTIAGYIKNGLDEEGLNLYNQMTSSHCLDLEEQDQITMSVVQRNMDSNAYVANSVLDMYVKSGSLNHAQQVFNGMDRRDVVSYNTIMTGYVHNGLYLEAIKSFWQMQHYGVKADNISLICVLKACANLADLEQGMQIHGLVVEDGYEIDEILRGLIVDMYGKCGSIVHAEKCFHGFSVPDPITCSSMMSAYAQHGRAHEAIQFLENSHTRSLELDDISFICILSACSYAGLVDEGLHCFHLLRESFLIVPNSQHYTCIVDLLGRAGSLDSAGNLLSNTPLQPNVLLWTSLLGVCRLHGHLQLANYLAKHIFALDSENIKAAVLLSNTKATFSMEV